MHPNRLLIPLFALLAACSPHPGAGGWGAHSNDASFERMEIRYNGRADLFTHTEDTTASWRCFWAAEDKFRLQLKCVDASNTDNEQIFIFLVDGDRKQGQLLHGRNSLGQYAWQPPTEPVEED